MFFLPWWCKIPIFEEKWGVAMGKLLDTVGCKILEILQEEGRISYNDLATRVGLSSPAVADRIKKMEEQGIIKGFRAVVNYPEIGYGITVFVRIVLPANKVPILEELAKNVPEIIETYHVTGTDGMILKIISGSMERLEEILRDVAIHGVTNTSLILSSPVNGKVVQPLNSKHSND